MSDRVQLWLLALHVQELVSKYVLQDFQSRADILTQYVELLEPLSGRR